MRATSQLIENRRFARDVGALLLLFQFASIIGAPATARADTQQRAPESLRGTGSFRAAFGPSFVFMGLPLHDAAGEQTLSINGEGLQLSLSYMYNVGDHFAVGGSLLGHSQMLHSSGLQSVPGSSGNLQVLMPALGGIYRPFPSENGGIGLQVGWTFADPSAPNDSWHGPIGILSLVGEGKRGAATRLGSPGSPTYALTFWYAPVLYPIFKSTVLSGQSFAADEPGWMIGFGVAGGVAL